jgi:hypothetical protein
VTLSILRKLQTFASVWLRKIKQRSLKGAGDESVMGLRTRERHVEEVPP